jgi:hypothetical protein
MTLTSFVEDLSGKRARRGSLGRSSTNSRKSPVRSRRLLRLMLVEDAVSVGTYERVERAQPAAAIVVVQRYPRWATFQLKKIESANCSLRICYGYN